MKHILFTSALFLLATVCFAQFKLTITIAPNDSVTCTMNGNAIESNNTARATIEAQDNLIQVLRALTKDYAIRVTNAGGNNTFTVTRTIFSDNIISIPFKKGEVLADANNSLSLPMQVEIKEISGAQSKLLRKILITDTSGSSSANIIDSKTADPTSPSLSQIAYYDAINLNNPKISAGQIQEILSYYAHFKTAQDSATLTLAYAQNPFINSVFVTNKLKNASGNSLNGGEKAVPSITASFTGVGALDVTNIADGIARFLIKRGKEEINAAFFGRIKQFLDKHPEFKILFPATEAFLENITSYQYAEFIQSLRDAFKKDMSNMIVHLDMFIELPKYKELLDSLPEIRMAIHAAGIVSELSQSDNPIYPDSIIHQLAMYSKSDLATQPNIAAAWQLLDIFSQSLRNKTALSEDDANRWITLSDFNKLLPDWRTPNDSSKSGDIGNGRIYLGLLYQQVQGLNISFKSKGKVISLDSFFRQNQTRISHLVSLSGNFIELANDVDRSIKDIRKKQAGGNLTDADYYTYINKAINITAYGFTLAQYINPDISGDRYILIARNANEMYKDIYTKNYNSAVMDAYNILSQLFQKGQQPPGGSAFTAKQWDSIAKTYPQPAVLETFLKYGNFIASIVKAQTPEEVENVIEAAALPTGSYSIKQRSSFNFGLNGYIGYTWDFNGGLYASGVYAPVGLAVSTGLCKGKGGALSLFAGLIDVGGIATYRLKDGNTDNLKQEVRLESIFSPSAQLTYTIPKWPLAVCLGYRRTPKLFYSSQTDFMVKDAKNVFNLAVLIDIPIFNFINRPFVSK